MVIVIIIIIDFWIKKSIIFLSFTKLYTSEKTTATQFWKLESK
jgi:hypothetical protein